MATSVLAGGDILIEFDIAPGGLRHYLKMVAGQPRRPRIKCDQGRLLLVSPGLLHERSSQRLDAFLKEVFDVLNIPILPCASTLFRQADQGRKERGVEPDLSYYVQNFARVCHLEQIDLRTCPPPDLVVEVVDSHRANLAIGVCRKLGVPEVWVFDVRARTLTMRTLVASEDGGRGGSTRYVLAGRSRVLPTLRPEDVAPWGVFTAEDHAAFRRRARAWIEAELVPRPGDDAR